MGRLLRAELKNPHLAARFDRIYAEALEIWDHEPLPKFTTHGRAHIEQVEENLDKLTRPLQESEKKRLSDEEIFVLLAGSCLHDIGMHRIDDPDVRENHPVAAYDMILNSSDQIPIEFREVTLPIKDPNATLAIAKIARGHWTEYALPLPAEDFICGNKEGRLRLLALLLAMADLLDMSSVRAHYSRSSHRFYRLGPVSELHHAKHRLVKGCSIKPTSPGLQFELKWRDNDGLVDNVNGWVMQWFNAQCRQLHPALHKASDGLIQWAKPWANVIFEPPEQRPVELSPAAKRFLMLERAEQIRINREAFASRFRESIANKEAAVFLFTADSDFDWRQLSDWCEAYGRSQQCHVAKVDVRGLAVYQFGSILAQILTQWKKTLPVCSSEETTARFESYVKLDDTPDIVTIVKTDEAGNASLPALLKLLMLRNSAAARVCFLICPKGKGPVEVDDATIVAFDGSTFPREEVETYLQKQHGFSEPESKEIYNRMERAHVTTRPADVYAYIEDYCK